MTSYFMQHSYLLQHVLTVRFFLAVERSIFSIIFFLSWRDAGDMFWACTVLLNGPENETQMWAEATIYLCPAQ